MPCARDSYVRPGNNSEGLQVRSVLLIIDVIPNPESGVPITSTKQGVGCRLVVATATSFDATDPGSDNPVSLLLIYWPLYSGRRVTCCRTKEDQIMVAIATSRRIFTEPAICYSIFSYGYYRVLLIVQPLPDG